MMDATQMVERRRALGLRQADLAGVSERFVRELEGGKPSVRLDLLVRVLNVLGLELVLRRRSTSQSQS